MASNLQTVLKNIWDDKALLITVLVGGGALVYLAFFRNNSAGGTLEAPNSTPTDSSGGYNPFDYAALATPTSTIINVPAPVVNNIPVPVPTPVSSPLPSPLPGTRQLPTVTSGWLASTPGGTNNKGKNLANLAKGTIVTLLSTTASSFGGNRYYQVQAGNQKGYVNAKTLGL